MRMEQNARGMCNGDFDQFSRFLRGNRQAYPVAPRNDMGNDAISHSERSLAMVYAVEQPWQGIYDSEIALVNGTIFEALDKPFYPSGCSMSNGCRGRSNGGCQR